MSRCWFAKVLQTALPSHFYPSDHLPLKAEFLFHEEQASTIASATSEPTSSSSAPGAASSVWNQASD
jgi:hypothetical protein